MPHALSFLHYHALLPKLPLHFIGTYYILVA
jgi:hypothetical protein